MINWKIDIQKTLRYPKLPTFADCYWTTMAKISINLATGSLQKEDIIVGIDLGTTNSLVAFIDPDKNPKVINDTGKGVLVPSVVHFGHADEITVGNEAKKCNCRGRRKKSREPVCRASATRKPRWYTSWSTKLSYAAQPGVFVNLQTRYASDRLE